MSQGHCVYTLELPHITQKSIVQKDKYTYREVGNALSSLVAAGKNLLQKISKSAHLNETVRAAVDMWRPLGSLQ